MARVLVAKRCKVIKGGFEEEHPTLDGLLGVLCMAHSEINKLYREPVDRKKVLALSYHLQSAKAEVWAMVKEVEPSW